MDDARWLSGDQIDALLADQPGRVEEPGSARGQQRQKGCVTVALERVVVLGVKTFRVR